MDPTINAARRAAWIDLLLFSALATPVLSVWLLQTLFYFTHPWGNVFGELSVTPNLSTPITQLCLNIFGMFGVFFAWARLQYPLDFLAVTGWVKLYVAGLFALGLSKGLPLVLLVFLLVDVLVGLQHLKLSRFDDK